MAFTPDQKSNTGSYIPQSIIYDSQDQEQLIVALYQSVNNLSVSVNTKETGYYVLDEFLTGALFYSINPSSYQLRPVYRHTYNTGALGAGATTIAHGLTIDASWQFVKIYGAANDSVGGNYYPIPTTNLDCVLDNVNIVITNGTGIAFTTSCVIVEYLKA